MTSKIIYSHNFMIDIKIFYCSYNMKSYFMLDSHDVFSYILRDRFISTIKSLAPGGFDHSLKLVNFKLISMINILSIFCEIAIRWMPQHLTDLWSILVQVMAWCYQATSHYLSQCWHRSMSPYDVTRPQWVELPQCQWRNPDRWAKWTHIKSQQAWTICSIGSGDY